MIRLSALGLTMLLLAGCEPEPAQAPWREAIARSAELRAAGDLEAATSVLKRALREAPEEPRLHMEMARVDLQRGRSDLTLRSLDKARERGADAAAVIELRARALYAGDRRLDLAALEVGEDVPAASRFIVHAMQARALADDARSLSDTVFERFLQLNLERDALAPRAVQRLAEEGVFDALDALEQVHPSVLQARAHVVCAAQVPSVVHWTAAPARAERRHLRVGSGRDFETIAAAAAAARDGDVIEIEAGEYAADVAVWRANDLLVRGVGGRPHIKADGARVAERDVWWFTGNDIVVENVEISGARSPDYHNGAAIRFNGRGITLRHVYLHHNENGLLTANREGEGTILVEHSELAHNGYGDGYTHNIYVGAAGEMIMRYSYSHDVDTGHLVKSRAARTVIAYNRLSDEKGASSYLVDVPNGGDVTVVGNVLEQGERALNKYMISYGAEGGRFQDNALRVVNNSIYNLFVRGVIVRQALEVPTLVANNVSLGLPAATVNAVQPDVVTLAANLVLTVDHGLASPRDLAFAPGYRSPVVDRGTAQIPVLPEREYVHPLAWRPRLRVYRPDVGAYEACRGALLASSVNADSNG